jgi:hypothetical protein
MSFPIEIKIGRKSDGEINVNWNWSCPICNGVVKVDMSYHYEWCQGSCDNWVNMNVNCTDSDCLYYDFITGDNRSYSTLDDKIWRVMLKRIDWFREKIKKRRDETTVCPACGDNINNYICEVCESSLDEWYYDWWNELQEDCPYGSYTWRN